MHSNRSLRNNNRQESYPNITGGGFVSTGPNVKYNRPSANHVESTVTFDPSYKGQTYSVKYLGIVDGSMGILSRKMAL